VRVECGGRIRGHGGPAPGWLTEHGHRDPPPRIERSDLLDGLPFSSPIASGLVLAVRRRERQVDVTRTAREVISKEGATGRRTAGPSVWNGGRVRANAPGGVERGGDDGVGRNPASVRREDLLRLAPGGRSRSESWIWGFFVRIRWRWRIGRRGGIGAGRAAIPGPGNRATPDRAVFRRGTRYPRGTSPGARHPRGRTSEEERQHLLLPPVSAARIPPRRRLRRPIGCSGCFRGGKVNGHDLVHPLPPPVRRAAGLRCNDERGRSRLGGSRVRRTVRGRC